MVRALVEYMLGPMGMSVLRAYEANALLVNGAIVLYGALLSASHLNLRHLRATALTRLNKEGSPQSRRLNRSSPDWNDLSWEHFAAQTSRFPFIAEGLSLLPRRTNPQQLNRLLPLEDLLAEARGEPKQATDNQ